MEQIQLAYGLTKETITAIMMLYKNMKAIVRSLNGDADFHDLITGVLDWDTLEPYLLIICLDYVLWMSIDLINENDSHKKDKKQTIFLRKYNKCTLYR